MMVWSECQNKEELSVNLFNIMIIKTRVRLSYILICYHNNRGLSLLPNLHQNFHRHAKEFHHIDLLLDQDIHVGRESDL